jgi:TetR/AcrR family transcriptional repressor of nem operon
MNQTASQILDVAEAMIREGGYYGFSFRLIADQLDIKSSSVHYHFPTKEALGAAVAKRYTDKFVEALGEPTRDQPIQHYVELFKSALGEDGRACLCAILAGECGKLPESLRSELQRFSEKNMAWLEGAFAAQYPQRPKDHCRQSAMVLFSGLEGAMVFAALHGRPAHLTRVGEALLELIAN